MTFFVMLYTQDGSFTPLINGLSEIEDFNDIAKFTNEKSARDTAKENILGKAFGFEVFEIGMGS